MSVLITDKSPKTYVVLGCPGSGTSFLAKALHDQGVDMGTTNMEFYENLDFVKLNQEIMGGVTGRIKEVINKYKKQFWGFKDPQSAFTIDKILPHLEDDVYLVCIFRKPERVKYKEPEKYNRKIIEAIQKFTKL
jgi:hypothetical protein